MTGIIKTDKIQSSAGNDAVTIASNGGLTIGNATNTAATFSASTNSQNADIVKISATGTSSSANLKFNVASGGQCQIRLGGNNDISIHNTSLDTERLRILSSGGITFNGDTAAANALDDYEEGAWTPAVSTANVHHSQVGVYTKIGRMVSIQGVIDFTQGGTSFGTISGLPFTNSTVNYAPFSFREWYSTGITMSSNLVIGSTTTNLIKNYANSGAATNNQRYGFAISVTYIT